MKRRVDKTKKSNIKCEHCKYWERPDDMVYGKCFWDIKKNYWNRCENFDWRDDESQEETEE